MANSQKFSTPAVLQASKVVCELLAPAGNSEALHAAVQAGADAVYLGATQFNARNSAGNFTLEELAQACDYAHLRGVAVYLTLNTLVLPSELPDALELVRQAFRAGVDAFIVQDPGIAAEITRALPQVRLHLSTQMNIHSIDGLHAAHALGAKRVTLARELSLEELGTLAEEARKLDIELEVFAHGALCICYSGQCFMSSMVGGRSANRGRCAQVCRLPYELHNRALRKPLPAPGEHLLSPKDLCTIDLLPELLRAGVSSLKIEGRMKSPEYVKSVVGVYRAVLDRALEGARHQPEISTDLSYARATKQEKQQLSEAFSRGFTTAYLQGIRGNSMMSYGRPNNRGVFVGRVASVQGNQMTIASEMVLHVGDVLEVWTNKGQVVTELSSLTKDKRGNIVVQVYKAVSKGDRVFRVRNAEAAFIDDDKQPRVPVYGKVELRLGKPLLFTLSTQPLEYEAWQAGGADECTGGGRRACDGGQTRDGGQACGNRQTYGSGQSRNNSQAQAVTVQSAVLEPARTKEVSAEEVSAHINRMGTTPFELKDLSVVLDEGVGIGFSALHNIRTQAAQQLEEALLEPYHMRKLAKAPVRAFTPRARKGSCKVGVVATNPACARAAKKAGADFVYVPVGNYRRGEAVIAGQRSETAEQAGYPKQCIPLLPAVSHMFDERDRFGVDVFKRVRADKPVLVETLGQLLYASELGALPEVGPHVPVSNQLDLQLMHDLGARRIWLSPELSLVQIEELGSISPVPLGLTIMGSQELMITEHCVLMSQGPCEETCNVCARRKSPHYLKDRKGYEMSVISDASGRSHIYNAVPLDIAHAVPDLIQAGVSALMVDTTLMNVAETSKNVARAVRARDIALKSGNRVSKATDVTSGHLFRGVL